MKNKTWLLLLIFYLFTSNLLAQLKSFNVGVDVMPNYSFYSGEKDSNLAFVDFGTYQEKAAISYGVVLSYQMGKIWSLESGLKYTNRGHRTRGGYDFTTFSNLDPVLRPHNFESDFKRVYNYNYISVPLNIRLALGSSFDKGWYIRFGVSADFYLSSQTNYTYLDQNGNYQERERKDNGDLRKTDVNLNYGIGYAFLLVNNLQLSVEPAFDYMFYRFHHKGADYTYNSVGLKLRIMVL